MTAINTPGTYVLTAQDVNWTESSKGTPCLSINGVAEDGQHITAYVYFSDESFKRSFETMEKCFGVGYPMEEWPDKIKGQQYRAVVENDPYDGKDKMKVKWLNPLSFVPPKPKDEGGMFRKLNALARAHGAKASSPAPRPTTTSTPAQTPKPAPAPQAPVNDDDVPF